MGMNNPRGPTKTTMHDVRHQQKAPKKQKKQIPIRHVMLKNADVAVPNMLYKWHRPTKSGDKRRIR